MADDFIHSSNPQPYYKPAAAAGPQPCEVCGGKVNELRRGRCFSCYEKWADSRPVGYGARCVCCNERRRQVLRMVEFHTAWRPMCFNCAGQMYALLEMPANIEALREALGRERRAKDRRAERPDTRVFRFERRVGERRDVRAESYELIDDELVIEVITDLEGDAGDMDFEEHTRIHRVLAAGSETAMPGASAGDDQRASHFHGVTAKDGGESRHPFEPTIIVSLQ
ncbi:MAG: hypothetical protein IPL79_14920 [Myxococcales bacterium]|nr:hypothetical protein [Myxococcales bacterium]